MALQEIIAHKRREVALKKAQLKGIEVGLTKSTRSLRAALCGPELSFICEIKPASPSKGVINAHADVTQIATTYEPFAAAISVLADETFFGGSIKNVRAVSEAVSLPVLMKDVVVDAIQIYQGRAHGAHAVLLMLSVLNDHEYVALATIATSLAMDVITEVHTLEEMQRAKKLGATIIGINNRDLNTLKIDMSTTDRLLEHAPHDALIISESGFDHRAQIAAVAKHVDAVLIGSALMASPRVDIKLRELVFGRVKICGLTNPHDARLAYDAGAIFGGINFYPGSKRYVSPTKAASIMMGAPLLWGGIFVDQTAQEVAFIADALKLSFVQLHGGESPFMIVELRESLTPSVEIWKALQVGTTLPDITPYPCDKIVFDGGLGGAGTSFDWQLLANKTFAKPIIVAGGIDEHNIGKLAQCGVYAVDVASGAEGQDPRHKSPDKLKALCNNLKQRK